MVGKALRWLVFVLVLAAGYALVWGWGQLDIAVLSPSGPVAEKERSLLVLATWLMLLIVLPVFLLALVFVWRYRVRGGRGPYRPGMETHFWTEVVCWGVPCILIAILSLLVWRSCHELDPFQPIASTVKPLAIEVIALEWKWLFLYPEQGIATLNFVQFPTHTPIAFRITADAPMNSFWIPKLAGQIYAMPGMESKLHLVAEEAADFRGSSANLSGKGFSGMTFTARASSPEEFTEWVATVKNSPHRLDEVEYRRLLRPEGSVPPVAYHLFEPGLYDRIVNQYMVPAHG